MSLNLVTVVGYHIKSLKHLIEHYKDIVDDINVVVYRNDINDTILDEVTDIIKPYGLEVFDTVVAPIFNWEVVTSLYNKYRILIDLNLIYFKKTNTSEPFQPLISDRRGSFNVIGIDSSIFYIITDYHSTFASNKIFCDVETKTSEISEYSCIFPMIFCFNSMGTIFNHV